MPKHQLNKDSRQHGGWEGETADLNPTKKTSGNQHGVGGFLKEKLTNWSAKTKHTALKTYIRATLNIDIVYFGPYMDIHTCM